MIKPARAGAQRGRAVITDAFEATSALSVASFGVKWHLGAEAEQPEQRQQRVSWEFKESAKLRVPEWHRWRVGHVTCDVGTAAQLECSVLTSSRASLHFLQLFFATTVSDRVNVAPRYHELPAGSQRLQF